MFDQEDSELNVVMGVVFGVIALVIGLTTDQLGGKQAAPAVAAPGADKFAAAARR